MYVFLLLIVYVSQGFVPRETTAERSQYFVKSAEDFFQIEHPSK